MPVPEGLPKMEYRYLGRSGLQVSAISLGGWLTYGEHVGNGIWTLVSGCGYDGANTLQRAPLSA